MEACPTRALTMTNEYELAEDSQQDLIFTKEQLLAPLLPGMGRPPHPMWLGEDRAGLLPRRAGEPVARRAEGRASAGTQRRPPGRVDDAAGGERPRALIGGHRASADHQRGSRPLDPRPGGRRPRRSGWSWHRNTVHAALWLVDGDVLPCHVLRRPGRPRFPRGGADHRLRRRDHDPVPVRADARRPRRRRIADRDAAGPAGAAASPSASASRSWSGAVASSGRSTGTRRPDGDVANDNAEHERHQPRALHPVHLRLRNHLERCSSSRPTARWCSPTSSAAAGPTKIGQPDRMRGPVRRGLPGSRGRSRRFYATTTSSGRGARCPDGRQSDRTFSNDPAQKRELTEKGRFRPRGHGRRWCDATSYYLSSWAVLFTVGAVGHADPPQRHRHVHVRRADAQRGQPDAGHLRPDDGDLDGQIVAFFVMVVAAAEVVVGLGIIMSIFRSRRVRLRRRRELAEVLRRTCDVRTARSGDVAARHRRRPERLWLLVALPAGQRRDAAAARQAGRQVGALARRPVDRRLVRLGLIFFVSLRN